MVSFPLPCFVQLDQLLGITLDPADLNRVLRGESEELLFLSETVDLFNLLIIGSRAVDGRLDEGRVFWVIAVEELGEGPTGWLLPVVNVPGPHNDDFLEALLLGDIVGDGISDPAIHA